MQRTFLNILGFALLGALLLLLSGFTGEPFSDGAQTSTLVSLAR